MSKPSFQSQPIHLFPTQHSLHVSAVSTNLPHVLQLENLQPELPASNSIKNNLYLKIVSNSMNGLTEEEGHKNINKIIINLAKKTIIDKYY